ncbi:MAG TPA: hypothetical protein VGN69_00060 [Solirubrobacteraceae bacterium]|nr:hypothetical protein [Solirubrobacteraceae bacterium]
MTYVRSLRPRAVAAGGLAGLAACALIAGLAASGPGRHAAGAASAHLRASAPPRSAAALAGSPHAGGVTLVPDPEAAQSFPEASAGAPHPLAQTPGQAAASTSVAPGAPSDAQVRQELAQMRAALRAQHARVATARGGAAIDVQGSAQPPPGAPVAVARVIAGANAIATFPYRFGGGHASFVDDAYDCSGSLSYALAAGAMVSAPLTSGDFEHWGVPGPGRWITVLANVGHTYMYVAGLRFDTSGRSGPLGSRWQTAARSDSGFTARHWPGL